jgi:murein DD-endopeptidase MepM/ murein hydrolase activator NlpD
MRIARVALSFFSVGFLAGSFEQAAGVGAVQRGQRQSPLAASASIASTMTTTALAAEPVAARVTASPSRGEPVSPGPVAPENLALALRAPAETPLPVDAGDARVAELVAAAFLPGSGLPGAPAAIAPVPPFGQQQPMSRPDGSAPLPLARRAFVSLPPREEPLSVPGAQPEEQTRPSSGAPDVATQADQEFIMPIDSGRVTSMFNQGRYHPAIDLAAPLGTPVHATTRKQRVTFAGPRGGYGNLVVARDPAGREHYYGHLQRIVAGIGALLEQGDLLGLLGSTGHSTGPHVHYEVRTRGGGHLNPATLLFPGRSVSRGYAWNNTFGTSSRVASAAIPQSVEPAVRSTVRRTVRSAHRATRRYVTRTPRRAAIRYAGRYGQPRPR